jgi:DNA-binding transcriptional ArsR family regulator
MGIRKENRKNHDEYEKVFHALAHPTRRHVLVVINAAGGQMTSGEIAARFPHKWPTVTRHMRLLEMAGLVSTSKTSREQVYSLDKEKLENTVGNWMSWFHQE